MTSETSGLGEVHLDEAGPLVFTKHFSDLDSSLNVAAISVSISITVEAGCGMTILGRPEVEMTSETSALGGAHLIEASPLHFTRHFSDLDRSLNVASIPQSINNSDAVYRYRAYPK